jgi:hypothetical protein
MPTIFISYRRDDAFHQAGRLADRLMHEFGKRNVFIDLDSISAGDDFSQRIDQALTASDIALVLIGPGWLSATANGRRRLDDPKDFVRREIASALARADVLVVPLLLDDTVMPPAKELPREIKPLAQRQSLTLSRQHWKADESELVSSLHDKTLRRTIKPGSRWSELPSWAKVAVAALPVAAVVAVLVILLTSGGSTGKTGSCGGGVSVDPATTTCPFAQNVKSAYNAAGGGNVTVTVFSPVTHARYTMACRQSAGRVLCTGGHHAVVYLG